MFWASLLYSHYPSPPFLSCRTVHESYSICKQTANRAANGGTNKQVAHAQSNLSPGVEQRQIYCQTRKQPTFQCTIILLALFEPQ